MEQIDQSDLIKLQSAVEEVRSLAQQYQGKATSILEILRVLEKLHAEINEELFQPALPNSRHSLFDLLRNIEANGGWPYIYRISLSELYQNLRDTEVDPEPKSHPQAD